MTAICLTTAAKAQEDFRFDAGGGIGMTGYLGDANSSFLWKEPSANAEVRLRYIANPRWSFKTGVYGGWLKGDSGKNADALPFGESVKFNTSFLEVSECAELNFFDYGMGEYYRRLKRWTPYISAGIGVSLWNSDKTRASLTVPVGFGMRYKPSRRVNFGMEFLMKKTFSDRLDKESLDDPNGIKSSFVKNTDWYSTLTFTVSYEFSKRCAVCNYKD